MLIPASGISLRVKASLSWRALSLLKLVNTITSPSETLQAGDVLALAGSDEAVAAARAVLAGGAAETT